MSEYIAPDPFEGKDMKDLVLDMALIGMAVLGIRAYIEPDKYDHEHWLVQRGIDTARGMGYITPEGVSAPMDVLEMAYPKKQNNGFQ